MAREQSIPQNKLLYEDKDKENLTRKIYIFILVSIILQVSLSNMNEEPFMLPSS